MVATKATMKGVEVRYVAIIPINTNRLFGVPEGIRTPDLRFRKPLLYPAELPGHALLLNRGTPGGKGPDGGFPVRGGRRCGRKAM